MRSRLTYANVMVTILLFIVLGGGAYAATQLPKNSVGAKQLKKGAVTKAKIQKKTLKALQGAVGPVGPAGPAGAPGGTLAQGVTLRGVATTGVQSTGPEGTSGSLGGISFGGSQLASRPSANIVPAGGASTASCPGTVAAPEAAPGNLCVYVAVTEPSDEGLLAISDSTASAPADFNGLIYELGPKTFKSIGEGKVSRFGFQLTIQSPKSTNPQMTGSWAVTGN